MGWKRKFLKRPTSRELVVVDYRLSAARICLKRVQTFHGSKERRLQNVIISSVPRTFARIACRSFTD
eukprot:7859781-Pyramimonas_sp.AAC.1